MFFPSSSACAMAPSGSSGRSVLSSEADRPFDVSQQDNAAAGLFHSVRAIAALASDSTSVIMSLFRLSQGNSFRASKSDGSRRHSACLRSDPGHLSVPARIELTCSGHGDTI